MFYFTIQVAHIEAAWFISGVYAKYGAVSFGGGLVFPTVFRFISRAIHFFYTKNKRCPVDAKPKRVLAYDIQFGKKDRVEVRNGNALQVWFFEVLGL